jgi:hypothetical protein
MDLNVVLLQGALVAATERRVGAQGRTLVELRLAILRPGRTGEGRDQIPVTIWAGDVGAVVRALPLGTPLTVVGRLTAREWNSRWYLECLAEHVTVDVATWEPGVEPPPARRVPTPEDKDDDIPF